MADQAGAQQLFDLWKKQVEEGTRAWLKMLEQAMGTESFAQAMGKQLEGFLNQAGPVKKAAEQHIEATLAGLGVPSRSQVVGIAKQIIALEEKIDAVDDRIDTMLKRLEELTAAVRKDRA